MASRRFFYDDCRSSDRLTRDYFCNEVTLTAALGGYDSTIKRNFYRISKAIGGSQFSAMFLTAQKFKNFELQLLMRNNKPGPNENSFWIFKCPSSGIVTGVGLADIANTSYWVKEPFDYYSSIVAGPAFSINTWYNIKYREDGRTARYKRWAYGTKEPDWTFTLQLVNKATNMNSGNFTAEGHIGFGTYTDLTQIILDDIADIRITPVRRTGP